MPSKGKVTSAKSPAAPLEVKAPAAKGPKMILVMMRCPRCTNSFTIPIPSRMLACMYCGRPWFWPFVPICEDNEQWAKDFVAEQEAKFRKIGKDDITPTDEAKAKGNLLIESLGSAQRTYA